MLMLRRMSRQAQEMGFTDNNMCRLHRFAFALRHVVHNLFIIGVLLAMRLSRDSFARKG